MSIKPSSTWHDYYFRKKKLNLYCNKKSKKKTVNFFHKHLTYLLCTVISNYAKNKKICYKQLFCVFILAVYTCKINYCLCARSNVVEWSGITNINNFGSYYTISLNIYTRVMYKYIF